MEWERSVPPGNVLSPVGHLETLPIEQNSALLGAGSEAYLVFPTIDSHNYIDPHH